MPSPYLSRPVRTVEQVMAERLRRPVPVSSRRIGPSPEVETDQPANVSSPRTAEGGGD